MALTNLTESIVLHKQDLCEGTDMQEKYGLDPDVYLAVIPADLSEANVVNKNNRIYPLAMWQENHSTLATRVKESFVDGERGHPTGGQATFDVAVRIIEVTTSLTEAGTEKSQGLLAFINTTEGRDLYTLYKAGFPLGTSSRARGRLTTHKITEDSPYWDVNEAHRGKSVWEVQEWTLGEDGTFDVVRDPSASTFLHTAEESVVQAHERLSEVFNQEDQMPFTQEQMDEALAELTVKHKAALAEQVAAHVVALAEQKVSLDKSVAAVVSEAAVIAKTEQDKELAERVNILAERVKLVEGENQALKDEKASVAKRTAMEKAIAEATAAEDHAASLKNMLTHDLDQGILENADQIGARFTFYKEIVSGLAEKATGRAPVDAADEADDDVAEDVVVPDAAPVAKTAGSSIFSTMMSNSQGDK